MVTRCLNNDHGEAMSLIYTPNNVMTVPFSMLRIRKCLSNRRPKPILTDYFTPSFRLEAHSNGDIAS